jgi:hypothetical protein
MPAIAKLDYTAYQPNCWYRLDWLELGFQSFEHVRRNLMVYATRNNLKARAMRSLDAPTRFCFQFVPKEPVQ